MIDVKYVQESFYQKHGNWDPNPITNEVERDDFVNGNQEKMLFRPDYFKDINAQSFFNNLENALTNEDFAKRLLFINTHTRSTTPTFHVKISIIIDPFQRNHREINEQDTQALLEAHQNNVGEFIRQIEARVQ